MPSSRTATVRTLLVNAGYTNVVAGDRWPSTDAAMLVLDAPGAAPQQYLDGGAKTRWRDGVQILVRGAANDFEGTQTRALGARDAVHVAQPTGYESIEAVGSVSFIGRDGDDRPLFSINFIATIEE